MKPKLNKNTESADKTYNLTSYANKWEKTRMRKQLLTLNEVADYLKISASSVYKLAREGKIPAFKVLNKWRFDSELIDQLVKNESYTTNPTAQR